MSGRVLCGAILESMVRMDATKSAEQNPFQRARERIRTARLYRACAVSLAALTAFLSTVAYLAH